MLTGNTGQITLFISTRSQLLWVRIEANQVGTASAPEMIVCCSVMMVDPAGIKRLDALFMNDFAQIKTRTINFLRREGR